MRRREPDVELESLVRDTFPFLFADRRGQIVSSERLPGTGNGQIFVRAGNVLLRVIRKEGTIKVLAAPDCRPNNWQAIEFLLMAADPDSTFPPPPVYDSLHELPGLLEPRMAFLNDALSAARFKSTFENSRLCARRSVGITEQRPVHMSVSKRVLVKTLVGIAQAIRFLIPRSKDNYANTLPIGSDTALEADVKREFGLLFKNYGARIISAGRLRIMDFAYVVVEVGNLRLRVARDRGSVGVSVAPVHADRCWYSLTEALLALQDRGTSQPAVPSSELSGSGSRIANAFTTLNEAFSHTRFPTTREKITDTREMQYQAWIQRQNKNHKHAMEP